MKCFNHATVDAIGTCVGCGKFICETCKTEYKNKFYCKTCLSGLLEETEKKSEHEKSKWEERAWDAKDKGNTNIVLNASSSSSASASAGGVGGQFDANTSSQSKMTILLVAIFFGWAGAHRFMVGKVMSGLLYLFTAGLGGIGWLYDILKIVTNSFQDAEGKFIKK